MRISHRFATALVGLALVAAGCSGGGDEATSPITAPPSAALPDAAGDALLDMVFDLSGERSGPTSTTTPEDRAAAEDFIDAMTRAYFEAAAAREWDAVYTAASTEFQQSCSPEDYAAVTSVPSDPNPITFGTTEVLVIGDFATGSFEVIDAVGTLRVEGLLAVWEADGWRIAIDPCGVAERAATGEYNYPVLLTTTTVEAPPEAAAANPTTEASIPPELTTTTAPAGGTTTTTAADITGPDPEGNATTTTTSIPPVPLSAADEAAIEAVVQDFLTAEAARDYSALHDSVPPLFSCTSADTAIALAPFHWSPTTVTFSAFTITGGNDEAFASFEITYADSGETLSVTDFGAWEWGGVWYAAVHPCKWAELEATDGSANQSVIDLMNDTVELARDLYDDAGDYDIPTAALNALDDTVTWVGTTDLAGEGSVAYVDNDQEVLILTQSASGRWYCVAEDATIGAHYGSAAQAATIDTIAGCRSVTLTNPFGP